MIEGARHQNALNRLHAAENLSLTGDLPTCQVCPTQGAVLQARAAAGAVRLRHALAGAGCSLASTQAAERVSTPPPHVALQGDHAPI